MKIVATYSSASRPEVQHKVAIASNGEVICTCEAYSFCKEYPKTCKHIEQAIAEGKVVTKIVRRPVRVVAKPYGDGPLNATAEAEKSREKFEGIDYPSQTLGH